MYFERLARVDGNVRGLNMYDDLILLSCVSVIAYGPILTATSSLDGFYELWIVNGTYTLGVSSPGYEGERSRDHCVHGLGGASRLRPDTSGGTTPELSTMELIVAKITSKLRGT